MRLIQTISLLLGAVLGGTLAVAVQRDPAWFALHPGVTLLGGAALFVLAGTIVQVRMNAAARASQRREDLFLQVMLEQYGAQRSLDVA